MRRKLGLRFMVALVLAALVGFGTVPRVYAATLVVTTTADSGAGSLRQAISDATSGDTITFNLPNPSTITLASQLDIGKNLTITGPGASQLAISGNNAVRVFSVGTVAFTLERVTVANGYGVGRCYSAGGGLLMTGGGSVTVRDSVFSGNQAAGGFGCGGAIAKSGGSLAVSNTTFVNNRAEGLGGAIADVNNSVTVHDSTFINNAASAGGGISMNNTTATVSNSTFVGNTASSNDGGGIDVTSRSLTLTNSTFVGNSVGVGFSQGVQTTIVNSTFFRNGVGIYGGDNSEAPRVRNTIVAESTGANCARVIIDEGYNISDDASCPFTAATSRNSTDLRLDPAGLQNNAGATQTVALSYS
ncbi:MAG: right-handed parallel beta-helix repeat-containing protein, partial [Chloroflexales bacterium]|nr:right-handed parallel beta-helix repeat-containing protein [Chloroflexales bacterium]